MNTQLTILDELRGGDGRSIGRTSQVVAIIRRQPELFPALIDGMHHDDEVVRMRAADTLEKLTVMNPERIQRRDSICWVRQDDFSHRIDYDDAPCM